MQYLFHAKMIIIIHKIILLRMRKLAIVGGARKVISLNEVHCSPLTAIMAAETKKKNNSDIITVPIAKNVSDIC